MREAQLHLSYSWLLPPSPRATRISRFDRGLSDRPWARLRRPLLCLRWVHLVSGDTTGRSGELVIDALAGDMRTGYCYKFFSIQISIGWLHMMWLYIARNSFLSLLKVVAPVTILSTFASRYNKDTIHLPILLLSDFPELILFDYSIHARRGSWRGIRKSTNNFLYVVQRGLWLLELYHLF